MLTFFYNGFMQKIFLFFIIILFYSTNLFAEYRLEPVNCTIKKKDNCGAYLYNTKTGSTFFCNSNKCTEILEALEDVGGEDTIGTKKSKKSKIPKKNKSKIPKFKKKKSE